jgi:DNA-binding NarL/FixJ family response regulator
MSIHAVSSLPARSAAGRTGPIEAGGRTVCVVADDLLAADGVLAHLKQVPGLRQLPSRQARDADVLVLVAFALTEPLVRRLADMRRLAGRDQRVVLVTDVVDKTLVPRAVTEGVVRIVPRGGASGPAIADAVLACHDESVGRSARPVPAAQPGFEYLRPPAEGTGGALSQREIAIVRLLALGLSTAEVASRLAYSERTIKSILSKLLRRLELRNRNQVIAYAYRVGAI